MWNSLFVVLMAVSWMGRMGVHGTGSSPEFVVPVMDGDNIQEEELRRILSTTGIVSIRMGDTDDLRQAALSHVCEESTSGVSTILPDGTKRSTLATATYGMHRPFSLPENNEALEDLRRRVAELSVQFQQALDRIIYSSTSGASSLMTNAKTMQSYTSVAEITSKATHLEHFHHYQAPTPTTTTTASSSNAQEAAVDVHVDAGLFLAFVPAMNCHHPHQPDRSLKLYLPEEHTAVLEPNTLVFMLGMGAQQWLSTSPLNLQATRHSLQLTSNSRAWYGMMHLVPANAIVQRYPTVQTFAAMKQSLVRSTQNPMQAAEQSQEYGIGCASQSVTVPATLTTTSTVQKRHTLEHVGDPSTCNNVTNFYCWMVCQPIPDKLSSVPEQEQDLHCMDPSVHHSTQSVEDAINSCRDPITGAIGGAMEDSCMGVWVATNNNHANSTSKVERPYCYGATSMLMQGFEWKSNVCLVYLFPQWTISSSNKMLLACFVTIGLGVVLEGILYSRRRAIQSAKSKRTKILFSGFFYSLQLTLGYALMLVVMTYSGPLVLSVVLGIVVGHFTIQFLTFNSKAAVTIPEGSTPCCQNDLNACTHPGCVANKNGQEEEPDCSCQVTEEESSVEANHDDEESPSKYCSNDDDDDEEFYKNLPPCCQNKQK